MEVVYNKLTERSGQYNIHTYIYILCTQSIRKDKWSDKSVHGVTKSNMFIPYFGPKKINPNPQPNWRFASNQS